MARRSFSNFSGRAKSEGEKNRLLERVCGLKCQGYSRAQISRLVNRSEPMVTKYLHELIVQGRLRKTPSGRIEKPSTEQFAQASDILKSEWLDGKNHEVRTWIEKMQGAGKNGTGLKNWRQHVSSLYTVCKTLNVQPAAFLISPEETERLLTEFRKMFLAGRAAYNLQTRQNLKSGRDTSIKSYVAAAANFCWRNGKPFTSSDGIMSRRKENYGVYANVQLSDHEVDQVLDFMRDHSQKHNWEALTAIGHEMMPRPDTLLTMRNNIVPKQEVIEDHVCTYAEALGVYEKKTHRSFDKLVFSPRCLELARTLQPNKTFLNYTSLKDVKLKFNRLLKEAYASIGRISAEAIDRPAIYRKVVDGDRYYLAHSPGHALRHSGCHLWLRRCSYNVVYVMSLGWDDPNMITQVYGKLGSEQRLHAGRCDWCRPPKVRIPNSNRMFCSWGHALLYYSRARQKVEGLA